MWHPYTHPFAKWILFTNIYFSKIILFFYWINRRIDESLWIRKICGWNWEKMENKYCISHSHDISKIIVVSKYNGILWPRTSYVRSYTMPENSLFRSFSIGIMLLNTYQYNFATFQVNSFSKISKLLTCFWTSASLSAILTEYFFFTRGKTYFIAEKRQKTFSKLF